jgi:hypothetical protein
VTQSEFDSQMQRITGTFGDGRVYSRERVAMIWGSVSDLSAKSFSNIVNLFIATLRQPPLPSDFREAAYAERKRSFESDVVGAAKAMDIPWQNGLQAFLAREYPGCKTLNQARDVQIEKNKIKRAMESA